MKKSLIPLLCMLFAWWSYSATAKTLVAFYSYTNNCRNLTTTIAAHADADVVEVQPAEKGLKYDANNYTLGTQLLNAIKANPDNADSYPAIDAVTTNLTAYDNIIIVTPLWWSQMAAIMQSFLFRYREQMADSHMALVVSSASSGISGVVADANRLLPDATWMGEPLWINNSNRSRASTLIEQWLKVLNFKTSTQMSQINITIDGQSQRITLADTEAAKALVERLKSGGITVTLNSSQDFEIWGALGFSLPTDNRQMTAQPGDVVLYSGSNICLFYGTNSWSYTPLGKIEGLTVSQLRTFLKAGASNISVQLWLTETTGIHTPTAGHADDRYYTLNGQLVQYPEHGVYIKGDRKIIR